MDDDVVFFAMVQRYNIYFKYVSLHHDILGSHGAKSSTENIYWADLYDKIKKSPEVQQLFHEFFDKHGLVRGGLYFDELARLVNRSFGTKVHAICYVTDCIEAKDSFKAQIKNIIDKDQPIILGIDFKKGGGHAVLAIGYEDDEDGLFHVFCLDPGYLCNPTSYWNMVISLDQFNGKYKHQCLTDNPYNCPAIQISDTLIVERV